jgi:hypothetical protein
MLFCTAGILPAAQILDALVRRRLVCHGKESNQIGPILGIMSRLPAVQQVPLEVYGCLLQRSSCMIHLQAALLEYPQAQHITPVMLCKALLVAARSGCESLIPPLVK